MSTGSVFQAEVQTTVRTDGRVVVMGRTYWSTSMLAYCGWEVSVRVPRDAGEAAQVWIGERYLASPGLILDPEFLDVLGAKEAAKRAVGERLALETLAKAHGPQAAVRLLRASEVSRRVNDERRALVVRRQAALLLEVLDQTAEEHEVGHVPFLVVLVTKGAKRLADLVQKV